MKTFIALMFATGTLMLAGCSTCHRGSTAYEYRVVLSPASTSTLQEQLNKAGADGFSFVSSQTFDDGNTKNQTLVILKKAKQ